MASRYGLDGPGIEYWLEARFSATVRTGPVAHPASYTMDIGAFTGLKRTRRGGGQSNHLEPGLNKEQGYTSTLPLWAYVACSKVKFTIHLLPVGNVVA